MILALFGTVAWLTLLSNYLAILLVGGAFIAVGLFISSLTENQVAAAIGGVVCLLAFFLVDTLASRVNVGWIQSVLYDLSFYTQDTMNLPAAFSTSPACCSLSAWRCCSISSP